MLLEAGTSPTITDIVSIQEYTLPQSVFIVYSVFPKGVHLCFIELFPLMWLLNEFLHCLGISTTYVSVNTCFNVSSIEQSGCSGRSQSQSPS